MQEIIQYLGGIVAVIGIWKFIKTVFEVPYAQVKLMERFRKEHNYEESFYIQTVRYYVVTFTFTPRDNEYIVKKVSVPSGTLLPYKRSIFSEKWDLKLETNIIIPPYSTNSSPVTFECMYVPPRNQEPTKDFRIHYTRIPFIYSCARFLGIYPEVRQHEIHNQKNEIPLRQAIPLEVDAKEVKASLHGEGLNRRKPCNSKGRSDGEVSDIQSTKLSQMRPKEW